MNEQQKQRVRVWTYSTNGYTSLADDACLMFTGRMNRKDLVFIFNTLNNYLSLYGVIHMPIYAYTNTCIQFYLTILNDYDIYRCVCVCMFFFTIVIIIIIISISPHCISMQFLCVHKHIDNTDTGLNFMSQFLYNLINIII